jgi:hypothetical protein
LAGLEGVAWAVGWFGGRASYPRLRKRGRKTGVKQVGAGLHRAVGQAPGDRLGLWLWEGGR